MYTWEEYAGNQQNYKLKTKQTNKKNKTKSNFKQLIISKFSLDIIY
jgi:hypothetical protein